MSNTLVQTDELATEPDPARYDATNAHCDVLIVGAGPAGLAAARALRNTGTPGRARSCYRRRRYDCLSSVANLPSRGPARILANA